jgi:hypothetical protein
MVSYLKRAFMFRWNMLLFGGAIGFSILSGRPDVWMPLAFAAECVYLGGLATHPKFQAYVEAQQAKAARRTTTETGEEMLARVVRRLPARSMERFETLRGRCLELQQIAREIKGADNLGTSQSLEQMQNAGLDRLLWIYLRLLFTEFSLGRFVGQTPGEKIEADIANLEDKIKKSDQIADEGQRQKVRRTLEDNLRTCQDRLANFQKARDNYEIVRLEIDRLENKIRTLSEMAVNRQEPDFVSTQVDAVATSMVQTEKTMNELEFATGLQSADDAVPELLHRKATVKA